MDNELLDFIEDKLREKFGADVITERSVDDFAKSVTVKVYHENPNMAPTITMNRALLDAYAVGSLTV